MPKDLWGKKKRKKRQNKQQHSDVITRLDQPKTRRYNPTDAANHRTKVVEKKLSKFQEALLNEELMSRSWLEPGGEKLDISIRIESQNKLFYLNYFVTVQQNIIYF